MTTTIDDSNSDYKSVLLNLNHQLSGELYTDDISRMLYACDASHYQIVPLGVVYPKDKQDCKTIVEFAAQNGLSIIPRAGGTSLAGQVVGNALIVDVSRHMTQFFEFDKHAKIITTQPGVIPAVLNNYLRAFGLMFAPDPSTLNRCTIAGMIGNNAWGIHCPIYGSTRANVLEIEALLSNAEIVRCVPLQHQQLQQLLTADSFEANIYTSVLNEIKQNIHHIRHNYPHAQSIISNTGYPLHELIKQQPFNAHGDNFNLSTIICGSEGTLTFVTESTLKLVAIPKYKKLICIHFTDLIQALVSVPIIREIGASTIELLDQRLLQLCRDNALLKQYSYWISGDPAAVLLVEYSANSQAEVDNFVNNVIKRLQQENLAYCFPTLELTNINDAWEIRRSSLGLLMGFTTKEKPITFVEDSAVPVQHLANFTKKVQSLMRQVDADCVFYGSVSMGLIHIRPFLDLSSEQGLQKYQYIADEICALIISYDGTMSAKHGDGRVRTHYIERQLGKEVYSVLQNIKKSFDPNNMFNPGNIVVDSPISENLRVQVKNSKRELNTYYNWQSTNGLTAAVEKCNGAAVCRRPAGFGAMCPSYMATLNEKHSTRGRANVIRQVLNDDTSDGLGDSRINDVLQLCIMCKACRSECPAEVDMARLKSEHLYHYQQRHGIRWRTRLIVHLDKINALGNFFPTIMNSINKSTLTNRLLGFHHQRSLPVIQHPVFSQWFSYHNCNNTHKQSPRILLLNDTFTQYYDPNIGIACTNFLQKIGCSVQLFSFLPSIRIAISLGLLEHARRRLITLIKQLHQRIADFDYIIGLEPSELLCIRDEAMDLLVDTQHKNTLKNILVKSLLFEEFILNESNINQLPLNFWRQSPLKLLVHVHCHQRSLSNTQTVANALKLIPNCEVTQIPPSCCGMAGIFGFDKEYFDTSMKIGSLVLFPQVKACEDDHVIVATGSSCRHQIKDATGKQALHSAQIFQMSVNNEVS